MKHKSDQSAPSETSDDGEARIMRAVWWSVGLLLFTIAAVLAWMITDSLSGRRPPESQFTRLQIPLAQDPRTPPPTLPSLRFTDITVASGLSAVVPSGADGRRLLPETISGGCAVFDLEGDGDYDILLIGTSGWSEPSTADAVLSLYRNDGHAHFADVTAETGLSHSGHFMAAAAGDADGDGQVDLFLSGVGDNRLLVQRDGRFVDVTEQSGIQQVFTIPPPRDRRHAASSVTGQSPDISQPSAGESPADQTTSAAAAASDNAAAVGLAWGTSCGFLDYDRDGDRDLFVSGYVLWASETDAGLACTTTGTGRGYCPPEAFAGTQPFLYQNDGQGHFTEISQQAGLVRTQPDTGELTGKSLSFAVWDVDFDGWYDLFVGNDTTPNGMFLNQRDGTFREVGTESGLGFDSAGMVRRIFGVDAAWLADSQVWALAAGTSTGESLALYRSAAGLLQFTDDALLMGFGPDSHVPNKICPLFCDFDLDGRHDLLLGNGGWDPDMVQLRASQTMAQPLMLYWNRGTDQFVPLTAENVGQDFLQPVAARSLAIADFDGDADPDVLVIANGGRPRLLRNDQQSDNHWLRVQLSHVDTVGTRVEISANGRRQVWLATPHRGYLGQSEPAVTFGLGDAAVVDELTINWSDGSESEWKDLAADQTLKPRSDDERAN